MNSSRAAKLAAGSSDSSRSKSRDAPTSPCRVPGRLKRNNPSPDATLVGKGCELHSVPEVSKAFDETVLLPFLGVGIEVVGTEVLIHRSVLEHVIDGRED